MKRYLWTVLVVCGVWLSAVDQAEATCFNQCAGGLRLADCSEPKPDGVWPADLRPLVQVGCKTCCSPPGGPLNCSPMAVEAKDFSILDQHTGKPVTGDFVVIRMSCNQETMLEFTSLLKPGHYEILSQVPGGGNLILQEFEVVASVAEPKPEVAAEGTGEKAGEGVAERPQDGGSPDAGKPDDTADAGKPEDTTDAGKPDAGKPDTTADITPDAGAPETTAEAKGDSGGTPETKSPEKTAVKGGCSSWPSTEGFGLWWLLVLIPLFSRRRA